jgi:DNA uptake protein ComE-like DNA-binding protein
MKKVNINKAQYAILLQIIHIGKKRAEKIIANRPYKDIHELSKVIGLGKKRMDDIITQGIAVVKDEDFPEMDEDMPLK